MQDTIINFYSTLMTTVIFLTFAAWPIKVDGKPAYLRTLFSGTKIP